MKFRQAIAVIFFAAFSLIARGAENPSLSFIFEHAIARAKLVDENDRNFNQLYSYSREKTTEFRNSAGDLKSRKDKISEHQPRLPDEARPVAKAKSAPQKNEPVSDTHSNVRGQAFKKDDILLNEDLLNRFHFTLAGKDTINGRPAFVIDFIPKKNLPEHNLKDRFINKAAGRAWIDAEDYALVKADLHLTKEVDVAWGLAGAVWKFNYEFDRARTDDGFWFTRDVNWHLEGREVVVNRIVDYHETTSDLQKVTTVASSR